VWSIITDRIRGPAGGPAGRRARTKFGGPLVEGLNKAPALFDCTLTSQINYKCYHIFSFVKFYMESTNQLVWVKYGTGRSVEVSIPKGCNVNGLIKQAHQGGAVCGAEGL
jgi:hypothetical protein